MNKKKQLIFIATDNLKNSVNGVLRGLIYITESNAIKKEISQDFYRLDFESD